MKRQLPVIVAICLAASLALSSCKGVNIAGSDPQIPETPHDSVSTSSTREAASNDGEGSSTIETEIAPAGTTVEEYIYSLVQETIAGFYEPGMSEFEMTKVAFDYIIETTSLIDPVGLDLWRIRSNYTELPSFVENRSLSVLQFQFGKCEDYAAAFTLLLRGMGLEAEYVPGLTYSTQGELVDHAWVVLKVDGTWYHVDCQLEQNISRHGSVPYKYFMRGDTTMSGSHRWGQNLINSGLLTAAQNEEIAQGYIPPTCPQDYPTPSRQSVTLADAPDVAAIEAAVETEFREYEQENGPLEPLEINIIPPVFALEGYGPQD